MRDFRARKQRPLARRVAANFAAYPCGSVKTVPMASSRARRRAAGSVTEADAAGPRGAGAGANARAGAAGGATRRRPDVRCAASRPCRAKSLASWMRLSEKRGACRRAPPEETARVRPFGMFAAGAWAARIRISRQRRPCSKGACMAGKGAQGAGPHPAGRKALNAPGRSSQYKEKSAQKLPSPAWDAGGIGLCKRDGAFDHDAQHAARRNLAGF